MATALATPDPNRKTAVLLRLLTGAKPRTLGYHPMTDDRRISPWDCADPGPLTVPEALNVLAEHDECGTGCQISRTARKVGARLIDAPTVRTKSVRGDE